MELDNCAGLELHALIDIYMLSEVNRGIQKIAFKLNVSIFRNKIRSTSGSNVGSRARRV